MDDNQIRIPQVDLSSSVDQLSELYQSLTAPCVQVNSQPVPENFCSTYSQVTGDMQKADFPFPVADNMRKRSVSPNDPTVMKTGREVCDDNAKTLFGIALDAANICPPNFPIILSHVHDGIYMARRAGWSDDQISKSIEPIRDALKPCLEKELPPSPPACSDGIDNDGDSLIDFPNDPGCTDANDTDEVNPIVSPPSTKPNSRLKLVLEIRSDLYANKFLAVDGQAYTGLKYYLSPDRRFIVESGAGYDYLLSLNVSPDNQLSTSGFYYYLGAGIALPRGFQIMGNTQWDITEEKHVIYYGTSTEPTIDNIIKLDFDAGLRLGYKGLQTYFGYHMDRGFYIGVGAEESFNIGGKKNK